jgi:hypothetical protein
MRRRVARDFSWYRGRRVKRHFAVISLIFAGLVGAALATQVDAQPKKAAAKKPAKGKKPPAEEEPPPASAAADAGAGHGAGTTKKPSGGGPAVVEEKSAGDGGVKTYKFGPVEVEGRLKSPQVVYFMRRVRAEFAAGELGHRSFLRELSDTRRHPALK